MEGVGVVLSPMSGWGGGSDSVNFLSIDIPPFLTRPTFELRVRMWMQTLLAGFPSVGVVVALSHVLSRSRDHW